MTTTTKRTSDKTRKIHRLLAILRRLDNRGVCTPETLAQRFGISMRNIFRDINDLNAAGFATIFDREINSYRFADPDFTLRDLDLNGDELAALLVGSQVARTLGKPFERAYESILKKVRKDTGIKTCEKLRKISEKQRFHVDIDPMHDFEKIERQYNAVIDAMDRKEKIEITYKSMHEQEETSRAIAPYGLVFSNGMWYAIAYCDLRKDIRMFALDCIKNFEPTSRHYAIPPDFDLDGYLQCGWRVMRYGRPVEVVLRFTEDVARWIKRRKWHPAQVIKDNKDGSIIFKVNLLGTEEIKQWSYSWAPYCEVISPLKLRREAAKEIDGLARAYRKEK